MLEKEERLKDPTHAVPVLYSLRGKPGNWIASAIEKRSGTFESRLAFPKEWRGMIDSQLTMKTGIPGCKIVHSSGFMAKNESLSGIISMIEESLKQQQK